MHSQGQQRTALLAIIVTALIAVGCRGTKPFGRFVKVTQETEADLPYVDPPQQRLATSRPRAGSLASQGGVEVTMTTTPVDDGAPADAKTQQTRARQNSDRLVANRRPAPRAKGTTLQQDFLPKKDSNQIADRSSEPAPKQRLASKRKRKSNPTNQRPSVDGNSADRNSIDRKSVDPEHGELLDAFADYPPEVQREALRRLVAATSKSATKTDQPSGFEDQLKKQAEHLPKLPAPKNTAADVPAIRLASDGESKPRRSSSVVTVADKSRAYEKKLAQQQKDAQKKIAALTQRVTDLSTRTIDPQSPVQDSPKTEPVVASLGDLPTDSDQGSVQTASAIRPSGVGDDMIARAAPESGNEPKEPITVATSSDADSLSDTELYRALVKQLSSPAKSESEAERATRLIKLRHLQVLSGDIDSAVKKIEGMSESEQEFMRHQLLGLWTMVDPGGHPVASRRITTALPQLRQATQFAAAATDSLEVRSVAFCTEIESYGQIKPFKSNRFDPGQQVILYCEIENFAADKSDEGYVTEMQGSYDIFDANNKKVVSQLLPADRQVSSNYLRDYYIAYQMHLPKQLPAGKYRLQLTMEDVGGKKYGQSSIDLQIAK